jgi:DNA polymerase II small subunit
LGTVAEALAEAVANGFQVEPEAYHLLQELEADQDPVTLIRKAMELKRRRKGFEATIGRADIEDLIPELQLKRAPAEEVEALAPEEIEEEVKVVKDLTGRLKASTVTEGYRNLFLSRYRKLMSIARERPDTRRVVSIANLKRTNNQGEVKIAGLLMEKRIGKGEVDLTIEDETGAIKVRAYDEPARQEAARALLDQLLILDLEGVNRRVPTVKSLYPPDIPDHIPHTASKHVYAVLTSDLHVGSTAFKREAFRRFLEWLKGNLGDRDLVRRIKYIIIAGDLVDGVGIYPDQEKQLEEFSIEGQCRIAAELLLQIPDHIRVFISPGNHDPGRQALPQEAIPPQYLSELYQRPNFTMLSNPAELELHSARLLVYHGRSLDDVISTTPGVSFNRPAQAMKLLLKARHLAPIYGGKTPLAPEDEDHLVIDRVPDIFHAGHIHVLDLETYRGVLIVNSGTWQDQTNYQRRMGINPTPGVVPIVDLATLEVETRNFLEAAREELPAEPGPP